MNKWEVAFGYEVGSFARYGVPLCIYTVVERSDGRTRRLIAAGLDRDEAHALANARETLAALEALWEAIHREDDETFDSERVAPELQQAFDVVLRAKGAIA